MGDRLWDNWRLSASGYTAVWAKENTREAIFDALKRREVYATSGPRILLKFFGGWNYVQEDLEDPEFFNKTAYEDGVPMGGSLTNSNSVSKPRFVFKISKDPKGNNIDKFQIIKGWVEEDGKVNEKVYNVIESANGKGQESVFGIWVDQDFKINQEAFYYARVLEVPTKRWSTYDQERYDVSLAPEIPTLIRERAYSSPIWFNTMK